MSLQVLIAGLGTYPCSSKMQRGRRLWGGVCVFGFAVAGSRIPPQPHPSFLSLPSSGMPAAVAAAAEAAEAAEATARGGGHGGGSGGGSGVGGVGGSLNGGDATQTPQHPASLLTWLVQARAAAPVSPTPGPDAALQRRRRSGSSSAFAAASSFRLRRRRPGSGKPLVRGTKGCCGCCGCGGGHRKGGNGLCPARWRRRRRIKSGTQALAVLDHVEAFYLLQRYLQPLCLTVSSALTTHAEMYVGERTRCRLVGSGLAGLPVVRNGKGQ